MAYELDVNALIILHMKSVFILKKIRYFCALEYFLYDCYYKSFNYGSFFSLVCRDL